jgi:hypothetical protein
MPEPKLPGNVGHVMGYSENELERERNADKLRWLDRPKQVATREGGRLRIVIRDVDYPCDVSGRRFVRQNVERHWENGRLDCLIVHEQEAHLVPRTAGRG